MGKMRFIILNLFIFSLAVNVPAIENCDSFLKNPIEKNYIKCRNSLLIPPKAGTDFLLISDHQKFKDFLSLLKNRNEYAVRLGLVLFRTADGAGAEELAIYLGKFVNYNPELLLNLFIEEKYCDDEIKFVLLILGDKYVDNFIMQREETLNRIRNLKNVKDEKLITIKKKCIKFLSEEEKALRIIIEEEKNKKQENKKPKKKKFFWFF